MRDIRNRPMGQAKRAAAGVIACVVCFLLCETLASAQSIITTYAGGSLPVSGVPADSQAIDEPLSVISDRAGGFYFASGGPSQNRVYHVGIDGSLGVVAGNGSPGFSGDGGPASSAQLYSPNGLALDRLGNLFISDTYNSRIRKVTPAGIISTVAGTGVYGFNGDGGPATQARLSYPQRLAVDDGGNLFIADTSNQRIRRVTADGIISTVAGTGVSGYGGDGAPAIAAQLYYPTGIAVDGAGALWIGDTANNRVRKVTLDGVINTVAGVGSSGFSGDGGPATSAQISHPGGVAVDSSGNLFIADISNYRIRKVTPAGTINTVAGNGANGAAGDGGLATFASLNHPYAVTLDGEGNLFIADTNNSRIRRVAPGGTISTFAGTGTAGSGGDSGPATSVELDNPGSVAADVDGNVYITDCSARLRKITPSGDIGTLAMGSSANPWTFCFFSYYYYYAPEVGGGIAVKADGTLLVAGTFDRRVYAVTPTGEVTIFAGTGVFGSSGDGGPATAARIGSPRGIAVDAEGNVFIADEGNHRIRKVRPDGIISTVAGTGTAGFSGDSGAATSAQLNSPSGVAVDAAGNLFIADRNNNRIRKVTLAGIISTVAGNGRPGFGGDGGPATSAQMNHPVGVAVDAEGNLFIADTENNRIRRVGLVLGVPTLTSLSRDLGGQGTAVDITLTGTSFAAPLNIDAGAGVTVSNIDLINEVLATATLTIASNAPLGLHSVSVTTSLGTSGTVPFTVVAPFPDLSITSSHSGNLAAGFESTYVIDISNEGSLATTGTMTVTDTLPLGLTYVDGTGSGWSCSASDQTVTCLNPESLAAGASTILNLRVAVGENAASPVIHAPTVLGDGDLTPSNNTASDATTIALPIVNFQIDPQSVLAGSQATADLILPVPFPDDVTGTLTLTFSPDAVVPIDDPAIQFSSGGRDVTFTIPANTVQARFENSSQAGPIGFQAGTVAGTLSFQGTLQTGSLQTNFATTRTIPRQAPTIHSVEQEFSNATGLGIAINLSSSPREVTELGLIFNTTPAVRLSCGDQSGCVTSVSTMTLDVRSLFGAWFLTDTVYGSASTLHVPFSIQGTVHGTVMLSLKNSQGTSNGVSFTLP